MLRCDLCILSSFLPNLKSLGNVLMKGQMAVLEHKWEFRCGMLHCYMAFTGFQ